jgi:hypothetical protein
MAIIFSDGMRRPKNPIQEVKLSFEFGIHINNNTPLATQSKQYYDKDSGLIDVIPEAINFVVVSKYILV